MKTPPGGWIKLHRSLFGTELAARKPYCELAAWVYLLLHAAPKPTRKIVRNKVKTVPRGGVYKSNRELAKAWGWSQKKVRNFLDLLEELGMGNRPGITRDSVRDSLIIITNFDSYQGKLGVLESDQGKTRAQNGITDPNLTAYCINKEEEKKETPTPLKSKAGGSNGAAGQVDLFTGQVDAGLEVLQQFGEKHFRCTMPEYRRLCERYGEELVEQQIPLMDEWIAKSDSKNAKKYRAPDHNHYLFALTTWLPGKELMRPREVKLSAHEQNMQKLRELQAAERGEE